MQLTLWTLPPSLPRPVPRPRPTQRLTLQPPGSRSPRPSLRTSPDLRVMMWSWASSNSNNNNNSQALVKANCKVLCRGRSLWPITMCKLSHHNSEVHVTKELLKDWVFLYQCVSRNQNSDECIQCQKFTTVQLTSVILNSTQFYIMYKFFVNLNI